MDFFGFFLVVLAVWRITHLFSYEDGPYNLVIKFRMQLGQSFFGSLLDCFYCLSIWVSLPFAIWKVNSISEFLLYWLALSGASCIIQKFIEKPTS